MRLPLAAWGVKNFGFVFEVKQRACIYCVSLIGDINDLELITTYVILP